MPKPPGRIIAAVVGLACVANVAHAQQRVRANIKDLNAADQQRFVDAMFALQRMAPAGGAQANPNLPQNRYEQYVRAHDRNGDVAHNNPFFLPWHRQLLFQMENDVRAIGAVVLPDGRRQDFRSFALPYWDGTRDAFPAILGGDGVAANGNRVANGAFASANGGANGTWSVYGLSGIGTPASPFVGTRVPLERQFATQNAAPVAPATTPPAGSFNDLTTAGPGSLSRALAMDGTTAGQTFTSFRRLLEGGAGLHNDMHMVVGRQMANMTSGSVDPAFWLVHSFIDLAWARWECDRGGLYEGTAGTNGIDDAMTGPPDVGGAVYGLTELNGGVAVTPRSVLNFFTMPLGGYTYDYRPNATTEDRVILGADGMCALPSPSGGVLLGVFGLLTTRRRRAC